MNGYDKDKKRIITGSHEHGPLLNQSQDWVWYQAIDGEEGKTPSDGYLAAEAAVREFIIVMVEAKIPHEQVYDPISFTKNLVFPDGIQKTSGIHEMLTDAGYKQKTIPEATDKQQSLALREAIMQGSNMSKKWH